MIWTTDRKNLCSNLKQHPLLIYCHTCLSLLACTHTYIHTDISIYIHMYIYIYIHGDLQIYTQGFCLSISSFKGCRCPVIRNPSIITTCDNLSWPTRLGKERGADADGKHLLLGSRCAALQKVGAMICNWGVDVFLDLPWFVRKWHDKNNNRVPETIWKLND
jgi:hypothetical protein